MMDCLMEVSLIKVLSSSVFLILYRLIWMMFPQYGTHIVSVPLATKMHQVVDQFYSIPSQSCMVPTISYVGWICKHSSAVERCVPKGEYPCDVVIFDLCCTIIEESDWDNPSDPYEAATLYALLQSSIRADL